MGSLFDSNEFNRSKYSLILFFRSTFFSLLIKVIICCFTDCNFSNKLFSLFFNFFNSLVIILFSTTFFAPIKSYEKFSKFSFFCLIAFISKQMLFSFSFKLL